MLQIHTCRELAIVGNQEQHLHNPIQSSSIFQPSKLQTLYSPLRFRDFLGFNLPVNSSLAKSKKCRLNSTPLTNETLYRTVKNPRTQKHDSKESRVFVGFKLQCNSKRLTLSGRCVVNGKKPRRYGGILPPILKSLESENDVEKVLELNYGKLNPKELTVILKEQRSWDKVLRVFDWMKSQKDYVPNVIHYNVVLRSLGKAKRWDELRLCWIDMAKNGVLPTNNTYGMLVDVYGKSGLVKESLLWIKHMKTRGIFPDEVTMTTVVRVLKDAGEYDRGVKFYKDWCAGNIGLDDLDLNSMEDMDSKEGLGPVSLKHFLLTELFKTGSRSKGWGLNNGEMSVQKPRLTATYNTLIDLYGKAGRLKDAGDVFGDMLRSGVVPDTITFNTMISICGTHGYLSEAESLLNKMKERRIYPDTKTYNILLSMYAEAGNIDVALQYYEKISEDGLFPDDVTYRALLWALCQRKMVKEVEAVIEEMEKLGKHIDEHSLPGVMKMYVDEELNEMANALFEKSQLSGNLSSRSYAAVMDVYADKGLWAEAEAIFLRKRDAFGRKKEVLEYNVLIKAYGKAKLYEKAFSLFRGMKHHGTWPDACTYNSVIQMFAGSELVDQARDLIAEMQEAGFKPSCLSFSAVVANYAQSGRLSDAINVFQDMSNAGVEPNEVVYGSLIDGFAEAGNFEEAVRYFREMKELGIPVNKIVLTSLIKAYGKVGYAEGAKRLYEKMKHLEGGPDIVASNSMLNLYAELGMVSEAELIFDHLKERAWADGVTFGTMMYVYKNMGMLDEAIAVAEEMKSSGLLRDCVAFNKVMACYATNGQLVACGELLHDLVEQKLLPDAGTFKVLFTVLKKGELPTEAVRQLQSSYQEGKPFARQAVITSVFSVVGLHAYALESCDILIKTEMGLGLFAYNAAIYAYAASGNTEDALNIYMRMQDEGVEPDIVTLIHLVSCYGKSGMTEGIKRIYGQLKYGDIDPSESLYKAIVDAYRNTNRNDLADMVNQEMRFAFEAQRYSDCETENVSDACSFCPQESDEEVTTAHSYS